LERGINIRGEKCSMYPPEYDGGTMDPVYSTSVSNDHLTKVHHPDTFDFESRRIMYEREGRVE
jgi:hypothetical protein